MRPEIHNQSGPFTTLPEALADFGRALPGVVQALAGRCPR
jgi:hypothetical protein